MHGEQDFRVENRQQWAVQNAANQVLLTAIRDLGSHIEVPSPYGAQDCAAVAGDNMDIDQLFEGGEEEEVWDAASPDDTGGSSGRSEGLDGSTSAGRNPLAALSVQEAIQYLKAALSEKNPGIAGLYGKLLNDLDRDEVRSETFECLPFFADRYNDTINCIHVRAVNAMILSGQCNTLADLWSDAAGADI